MKKELRERVEKAEKLGYKDRIIFWCFVILFPVCGFFFVPMRFSSGDIIYRYYFDVWIVWGVCLIVYVPYESGNRIVLSEKTKVTYMYGVGGNGRKFLSVKSLIMTFIPEDEGFSSAAEECSTFTRRIKFTVPG